MTFETKDSGVRSEYASGMVRDSQEGKPRFDLLTPLDTPYKEQLLTRWAELMGRGAEKYGDRNWEKGDGTEEYLRAKGSAFRHFMQWYFGETDEDHAAATLFNIQASEYFKAKLGKEPDAQANEEGSARSDDRSGGDSGFCSDGSCVCGTGQEGDTTSGRDVSGSRAEVESGSDSKRAVFFPCSIPDCDGDGEHLSSATGFRYCGGCWFGSD